MSRSAIRRSLRSPAVRTSAVVASVVLVAAGCGSGGSSGGGGGGSVKLKYSLWDDNQIPQYKKCAEAFHAKNPKITVEVTQTAWAQYWQNLTTQVVSGTAPDVFTNSVLYFPQFQKNNQILDLTSYIQRDTVDLQQYQANLADVWTRDGKRYGLPKDWGTMGVAYNKEMAQRAQLTPQALDAWNWNPVDGGDFGRAVAAMTVDENGRTGLEPGFDKNKVKTYGLAIAYEGGAVGQDSWGPFAVSNGFQYVDKNPFGTKYNYTDPKLTQTLDWFAGLIKKGYMPAYDKQSTVGADGLLQSGKAAMTIAGSWMAKTYMADGKVAFAGMPTGPTGRKTPINGLSDAVYANGKHKEQAWQWVKFLASTECQDIVAGEAVVFPAITTSSAKAEAAQLAAGRDMRIFTQPVATPGQTFVLPVTDQGDRILDIVQSAVDRVWLGQADAKSALGQANSDVNALLKK
ncbi:ABC transporter substrate-binding protein [Embleya sp. NPDC056575]|uniref:ABC transporter substrate-binding protein n=1 Tax=unclassified Embleya TaxID=2699296 RepID=UPI00368E0DD1